MGGEGEGIGMKEGEVGIGYPPPPHVHPLLNGPNKRSKMYAAIKRMILNITKVKLILMSVRKMDTEV